MGLSSPRKAASDSTLDSPLALLLCRELADQSSQEVTISRVNATGLTKAPITLLYSASALTNFPWP